MVENISKESIFESGEDYETILSLAKSYSELSLGFNQITTKELLYLSGYVKEVIREKSRFARELLFQEAAERLFHRITGYHTADFKNKKNVSVPYPAGAGKLIERLRAKFNQNDDTGSFEEI